MTPEARADMITNAIDTLIQEHVDRAITKLQNGPESFPPSSVYVDRARAALYNEIAAALGAK